MFRFRNTSLYHAFGPCNSNLTFFLLLENQEIYKKNYQDFDNLQQNLKINNPHTQSSETFVPRKKQFRVFQTTEISI